MVAAERSNPGSGGRAARRIVEPARAREDAQADRSLRPASLNAFIGQAKVKQALRIAIEAARERGDALDHILFHGPPGLGKTTLAMLIAREMGVGIKTTAGPILEKPVDLLGALTNLRAGDILFIDEVHRLRPVIEEFLYPAMEDFRVEIRLSEGPRSETMTMPIEPFTLVGATTRFGLLTSPMRSRFGILERLYFYPPEDLARIVSRNARLLGIVATDEGALELGRRSRGTPRVAIRLLRRVRDYAQVRADGVLSADVVRAALKLLEVDEDGLDKMDLRILRMIVEQFSGGPVGLDSLAVALGEDSGTLAEVYEPFLIQQGYMTRRPNGRFASEKTYERLGLASPEEARGSADGAQTVLLE